MARQHSAREEHGAISRCLTPLIPELGGGGGVGAEVEASLSHVVRLLENQPNKQDHKPMLERQLSW